MIELSVVIITYNEARRLPATLQAAERVADEIIIVDSGSTDDTQAVALSFEKVRWFTRPFDTYGQQKNYANAQASGRYILSLDADEVLSPALMETILAEKGRWSAELYEVCRLPFYAGRPICIRGWYPDWKVRLFKRGLATWDMRHVHERLRWPADVRPKRLAGELWHYTYDSIAAHWQRTYRYGQLIASDRLASGQGPRRLASAMAKAIWRFFKLLVLQGGWRAGWRGWAIALLGALVYPLSALLAHERQECLENPLSRR